MGKSIKSTSPPKRTQKVSNCVKNLEKLADAERESQAEKRKTLDSTLESLSPPNKMPNNAQSKDANVTAPALEQLLGQLRLNIKADTQVVIDQAVQSANSELKDEITAVADDVKDVAATMAKMDARLSTRMDNFDLRLEDNDDRLRLVMKRLDEQANTTKEVRGELQDLRDEMVSGNYMSLANGKAAMTHTEMHESYLLDQIKESKCTVTVINTKKPSLSPREMGQLLIKENLITKDDLDQLVKVSRMGNPRSDRIVYKVVLSTEAAASQLLERSRTDTRLVSVTQAPGPEQAAGRTATAGVDIVKVFPYTPQEYSEKEMQYRDMRSLLIPNGFLTRTHFEGTTMTLQARERGPGGVWVIVEGSSFKPTAPGRETPVDDEPPLVCEARNLLTACMAGTEGRPNAHIVHILSKDDITPAQASAKLAAGPKSTSKWKEDRMQGPRFVYAFAYKSRKDAELAVKATKEANPYILGEGDIIKLRVPWEIRPRQTAAEGT